MTTAAHARYKGQITRDRHLALVANSLEWVTDGDGWKGVPENKIYVIDLTASPPTQIGTVEARKQASGMAINRAGTLALVANRAENSVSGLAIGQPSSLSRKRIITGLLFQLFSRRAHPSAEAKMWHEREWC